VKAEQERYIVVIDIIIMSSSRRPRTQDKTVKFVLAKIFYNELGPTIAFKDNDIKTKSEMLKAIKDAETRRKMRWKGGDDTQAEVMEEMHMEELEELPSYFNWLQNNHGSLPHCPVEVDFEGSREMFDTFLQMTPVERETTDPNGVVLYDRVLADASEMRNRIGAYAHISNPSIR